VNLFIDNQDGLGQQDYTAYVDGEHLPNVKRKLNQAATMTAWLVSAEQGFHVPASGGRIILQRSDGVKLFTGYLSGTPGRQYLGYGSAGGAWRYTLQAMDDSWLLDRNVLPARAPLASRTAGEALRLLANDVLPGGMDLSGVADLSPVNQFVVVPENGWSKHAQELAIMARASYRAQDGNLFFQEVGEQSFAISEQDAHVAPEKLTLSQPDDVRNDVTIIGELEPVAYVRNYFLGNGTTLAYYLSETPFSKATVTVFQDDYTEPVLSPTLWGIVDPNGKLAAGGGQLVVSGGPATVSFVEQVELAGGILLQHGQVVFSGASTATIGGIYNGAVGDSSCIAGFRIAASGGSSTIQAMVNGNATGALLATTPGHQYAFSTQLFSNEAHREQQTYLSSTHPAGSGRGGDAIAAALRVVLAVHDVDPNNPGTLAQVATVLFDGVLASTPPFATYALLNATNLLASISFTRVQHVVDTEIRSMIPGQAFRTRLMGALVDGGECYVTGTSELRFYAPYPPQANEEVVVAYRGSARAMARVQDPNSIAAHARGGDKGYRSMVRRVKEPLAPTSVDCENAALAILDDAVLPAWKGEYRVMSDFLAASDVVPGNATAVAAPSWNANFTAIVREVDLQVVGLREDRVEYQIAFANEAAEPLSSKCELMTLPDPLTAVFTTGVPSSSLYLPPLTGAQVTGAIATEITVDAGGAPPPSGGIEVRRSDAGWGSGSDGNLAGRFTTQTFTLPRLSQAQSYYLRQYDASTPAKYSRYSALLYVDYPL
jgi:hypothetical protein